MINPFKNYVVIGRRTDENPPTNHQLILNWTYHLFALLESQMSFL